jgi:hypothetical protein
MRVYRATLSLSLMKDPKQDPEPESKRPLKSDPDPDPKKIIPDPQPCILRLYLINNP